MGYRLPTEAEWEVAARSLANGSLYTDYGTVILNDSLDYEASCERIELEDGSSYEDYAWYCLNSTTESQDAGSRLRGAFGLFDMAGNVREWTSDGPPSQSYASLDPSDEFEDLLGGFNLDAGIRGGSYLDYPGMLRHSKRKYQNKSLADSYTGFRLVHPCQ